MRLSIKDRFTMRAFYPEKSNWLNQVIMQGIQKKVDFETDEIEKLRKDKIIRELPNGLIDIDEKKEGPGKEVKFHDSELEFLKKQLDRLDRAEAFTPNMFETVKKLKAVLEKGDTSEEEEVEKPKPKGDKKGNAESDTKVVPAGA